ncbi:GPO family capsid scaffolding protein [Enterobacter ludwigii]|uniref:GPO family capsid scaffolding protein n=1 Tax=Enterobacter ludwigii TaxID=299767 RepID=UPI0006430CED|nr:GPO family capsid scaffolding protein [Enterobacter ludwigii]KLP41772.1 hypothetical protein ABR36_07980 [Enterobacter ludwigii]
MAGLTTDWVCLASAGKTVDGRTIDEQWLIDIADTYDVNVFTALIWPRHDTVENRKWSYNFGVVETVKLEKVDGVTQLFGQLSPNQFLIDANKAGQKMFTSIEVIEDFAGSGRYYLFGVAATDLPSSLGTTRLEFDIGGGETGTLHTFSTEEALTFSIQEKQQKPPFWTRFFSQQPAAKKTEDNMEKEQFDQLMNKLNDNDKRFTAIEEQLQTFSQKQPEKEPENKNPEATNPTLPDDKAPQWFEQYSQGVDSKLDELTKRFDQIDKKEVTKLPNGNPGGNEDDTWM